MFTVRKTLLQFLVAFAFIFGVVGLTVEASPIDGWVLGEEFDRNNPEAFPFRLTQEDIGTHSFRFLRRYTEQYTDLTVTISLDRPEGYTLFGFAAEQEAFYVTFENILPGRLGIGSKFSSDEVTFTTMTPDYVLVIPIDKWIVINAFMNDEGYYNIPMMKEMEPAPVLTELLQGIASEVLLNGLSREELTLENGDLFLIINEKPLLLASRVNNRNVRGEVDLGEGYFLLFDIRGNGSNVVRFEVVQR